MSPQASQHDLELIFLGTGTSSSVPHVECLTAPPNAKPCRTCLSTLTPEGKRNIRRNTSAVIRANASDGGSTTIVIDVGKNFQAAAIEFFPKYGLRRIDAVILSHPHADAINGLDDLRGWTLNGAIQPWIDLYLSQATYNEVGRAFPYLISREYASGGGDVPEFKWHIIDENVPFQIGDTGIQILPFAVHHGRVFGTVTPQGFAPTPTTLPSTPTKSRTDIAIEFDGLDMKPKIHPYFSFGFKIQESLVYISDVSHIPDETWKVLENRRKQPISVCVLDCLRLIKHTSHFGVNESVTAARRLGAKLTCCTGFGHEVSHEEYERILGAVGNSKGEVPAALTDNELRGISLIDHGPPIWMRPAFDGLRIWISKEGDVLMDE